MVQAWFIACLSDHVCDIMTAHTQPMRCSREQCSSLLPGSSAFALGYRLVCDQPGQQGDLCLYSPPVVSHLTHSNGP